MTNKRLYFDCPIKALYMLKEFGVVCDLDNLDLNKQIDGLIPLSELMALEKIYVAPESEKIFEPKEGDLVNVNEDEFCIADKLTLTQKINKIIMRGNKPFLTPLTEEPNVETI